MTAPPSRFDVTKPARAGFSSAVCKIPSVSSWPRTVRPSCRTRSNSEESVKRCDLESLRLVLSLTISEVPLPRNCSVQQKSSRGRAAGRLRKNGSRTRDSDWKLSCWCWWTTLSRMTAMRSSCCCCCSSCRRQKERDSRLWCLFPICQRQPVPPALLFRFFADKPRITRHWPRCRYISS